MELGPRGEFRMPITTVTMLANGDEYLLQGFIFPLTNFGANFEMETPDGTTCSGTTTPKGEGFMTCSDGLEIPIDIPTDKYGRPSGSYAAPNAAGTITAVGWGNESDIDFVRSLLASSGA